MKKKNLLYLLIVFLGLFFNLSGVYADDVDPDNVNTLNELNRGWYSNPNLNISAYENSKSAMLVCRYTDGGVGPEVRIYYDYAEEDWTATYKDGSDWIEVADDSIGVHFTYKELFEDDETYLWYNKTEQKFKSEKDFQCPKYASVDNEHFWGYREMCLHDTNTCAGDTDEYDDQAIPLDDTSNTVYKYIDGEILDATYDYINNLIRGGSIVVTEFNEAKYTSNTIRSKVKEVLKLRWKLTNTYDSLPDFVVGYIDKMDISKSNGANEMNELLSEKSAEAVRNGLVSEEERQAILSNVKTDINESIIINIPQLKDESCNSLLGAQMSDTVHNILTFIQLFGPVLLAIFTIIDFSKAAFSGDQEAVSTAGKKFIKRYICATLLFFIPLLVNVIFTITGIVPTMDCF